MSKTKEIEESAQVVAEPVTAPVDDLSGQTIYIGPSVPGLSQFTTFAGGIPAHIKFELLPELPELRGLFVPVEGFGRISSRLNDRTSTEFALGRRVLEYFEKKKGGI